MTTVLIVQSDPAVASRISADLRRAGYETELCGGPRQAPCPLNEELPCPLVDRADVLVYDAYVAGSGDGGKHLISHLRDVYADLPVVLTSADATLGWIERDGPGRVFPVPSNADAATIQAAIELALTEQGMAA